MTRGIASNVTRQSNEPAVDSLRDAGEPLLIQRLQEI
jgi:hypothetical protein